MSKKLSKREAGKLLNEEGRLSPLSVLQEQMELFWNLAKEEFEKGDREHYAIYARLAFKCAEALAPYRNPKLQSTTLAHNFTSDLQSLLQALDKADQGPLPKSAPDNAIEFEPDAETKH